MCNLLLKSALAVAASVVLTGYPVASQLQRASGELPPVPFVDAGACPFEGCVCREWTAKKAVVIRSDRRMDAQITFSLRAGEKVSALTGVVVTIKAGRVEFHKPRNLTSADGEIHIVPGQTLYLLTYQGEGYTKAWFNGRLYTSVDTADFFNGICERNPSRCAGKIEKAQTQWWVQVRNRSGRVGWTHEPEKFDGKNALE